MNFIAQVEEHLRDLGAEARKNHPGVKEASERAILVLRTLQNKYVTQVRKASANNSHTKHPTTALFQSQDLLRPFLLAVNYPNASLKMLEISFRAIRLLIEGHAILPGDGIHLIRVWTIQAQVVASLYGMKKKKTAGHMTTTTTTTTTTSPTPSSSSWFGGFSFSGSSSSTTMDSTNTASQSLVPTPHVAIGSGVVSSSSGQSGGTAFSSKVQNKKEYDRFAVEMLACLVMLLELPNTVSTPEQWSAAVALCCILLGITSTTNTIVPQAAKSTLKGVLSLLYQQDSNNQKKHNTTNLERLTWMDLLHLATNKKMANVTLKGAFCHCTLVDGASAPGGLNPPPSSNTCLELLHLILQQRPDLFGPSVDANGDAFTKTAVTLMELLRTTTSFGTLWRLLLLACTIITTQDEEWKPACRELLLELIYALHGATETCRQHDDFEDGYIYTSHDANVGGNGVKDHKSGSGSNARRGSSTSTHSTIITTTTTSTTSSNPLIPAMVLWKAALVLEVLHKLLKEQSSVIFEENGTLVSLVAEAVSDFATICASCRDNMLQLVVQCTLDTNVNDMEPTMFHRAEEIGKSLELGSSGEIVKSTPAKGLVAAGRASSSSLPPFPPCEIGEPIWIAFHCILLLSRALDDLIANNENDENTEVVLSVMDGSFAPSLAVLQHYLKRFPGSPVIVQSALSGYSNLAHVALKASYGSAQQKKALLSSLCKLSLPMWGKHDSASQLQDHHVSALLCLLNIMHTHHDAILSEWDVVLWTLEELSTLSISSPMLSNVGYLEALDVSRTYVRIAPLTACFSVESLNYCIEALAEISKSACLQTSSDRTSGDLFSPAEKQTPRSVETHFETTRERRGSKDIDTGTNTKDSIGGKLMSFAGRAMVSAGLGSTDGNHDEASHSPTRTENTIPLDQRTKKAYFDDYRHDFAKRMGESKRSTSSTDVFRPLPFALVALTDVAMSNVFRFDSCGTLVSRHLCSLADSSPITRAYTMDMLARLITSQISGGSNIPASSTGPTVIVEEDPVSNRFLIVKEVDSGSSATMPDKENGVSTPSLQHEALLSPLCECIETTERVDVAEAGISSLHSILEGVGHNVKSEAWTVIIDAISSLSGDPAVSRNGKSLTKRSAPEWSTCCIVAFRCVKLVVDDFLDHLPKTLDSSQAKGARTALLDCCSSFGSSRHDVNTSLTAIGMLWTIADQDSDPKSIDHAFSRLVFLCSDSRPEVRNCAVNTLFSCIVGRGQQFSAQQWKAIVCETIFYVFDRISLREDADSASNSENDNSSSVAVGSHQRQSRYEVNVHHSRDSEGKQWATTEVMALRGLSRVLRNFFTDLLVTVEDEHNVDGQACWFRIAWRRILDFALSSATHLGGRDTLELRKAGVELLILCSQLSSRGGMGAVLTPALYGTNMEVVDGALRSVRATNSSVQDRDSEEASLSEVSRGVREQLFAESFGYLEKLGSHLEGDVVVDVEDENSTYLENTQLQVLQALASGLSKLYECCKDQELSPDEPTNGGGEMLEHRFVGLIATVAKEAAGEPDSRFLTQAQRASLDLLRTMTSNASSAALKALAMLAGQSFLWEPDNDESETDSTEGSDLLGQESAKLVVEGIGTESFPREAIVEILSGVLNAFLEGHDASGSIMGRKRCYTLLVPVVKAGLQSASKIEGDRRHGQLTNQMWERTLDVISILLSSQHFEFCGRDSALTRQVLEILEVGRTLAPARCHVALCDKLTAGASNSLTILTSRREASSDATGNLAMTELTLQQEELLRLLKACLSAGCDISPRSLGLRSVCDRALQDALALAEARDETDVTSMNPALGVRIALAVCDSIQASSQCLDNLVIAVFPLLCQLTGLDHSGLRTEVGAIMSDMNLPQVLAEAEERARAAEERAMSAEERIAEMESELDELREENDALQQQVTVFSAASALT